MSERGQVEKTLRMIRVRQAVRRACDATGLGSRLIPLLIIALLLAGLMFGVAIATGLSTSSVMVTAFVSFTLAVGAGLFLLGTAPDDELAKAAESLESELQRIEAEPPPAPAPEPVPAAPAPVKPKAPASAPAPSRATQPAPAVQFAPPPVQPARSGPSGKVVDMRTVVVDIVGYDPLARCAEHPQQFYEVTLMMGGFNDSWVVGGGEFQEEMRLLTDGMTPEMNDRGNPNYWVTAKLIQEEVRPAGWDKVTFFGKPISIGTRPVRVTVNGKTIGFLNEKEAKKHRTKMSVCDIDKVTVEVPVRIYPPAAWMQDPGYGAFVYLPGSYSVKPMVENCPTCGHGLVPSWYPHPVSRTKKYEIIKHDDHPALVSAWSRTRGNEPLKLCICDWKDDPVT